MTGGEYEDEQHPHARSTRAHVGAPATGARRTYERAAEEAQGAAGGPGGAPARAERAAVVGLEERLEEAGENDEAHPPGELPRPRGLMGSTAAVTPLSALNEAGFRLRMATLDSRLR